MIARTGARRGAQPLAVQALRASVRPVQAVARQACSVAWRTVLGVVLLGGTALSAQPTRDPLGDPNAERRARAGIYLESGWHPYLAVGPAFPVGRLGDLTSLGVSGHVGAWFIRPEARWAGVGVEATYASFAKDTDEPLPGRYQVAGVLAQVTSKGKQRLFFDWLGGYGAVGVGVFRHGASRSTMRTAPGLSGSVGMLVPMAGYEGFVETRVQHLFSGETLGQGSGLTFAPLRIGVRF
jgi:hypothetical protein